MQADNKYECTAIIIFLVISAVMLAPFIDFQYHAIFNPFIYNDDARTNFPLYKFFNPGLFKGDYIGDYIYKVTVTPLWELIYIIGAYLHSDLQVTTKVSSILIWLSFLVVIGFIVLELTSSRIAALGAIIFAISCDVFIDRIMGGFARSYGFTFLGLTLLFLLKGRPWALALTAIFSAASYPPIAVISGLAMAALLLFNKVLGLGENNGAKFSLPKKITILALTACLCGLIILPQALSSIEYGRRVVNATDAIKYPECGHGGRPTEANLPPYNNFIQDSISYSLLFLAMRDLKNSIFGSNNAIFTFRTILLCPLVAIVIFFIGKNLWYEPSRTVKYRIIAFILLSALAHAVSIIVAPYFYEPDRFTSYPIPLLLGVLLPVYLYRTLEKPPIKYFTSVPSGIKYLTSIILFIIIVGGPTPDVGYTISINDSDKPLYNFISALPQKAFIAGWPGWEDPASNIPLITKKSILVGAELDYTFNMGFMQDMHKKTIDLIDVYFSPSKKDLIDFRDKYHLTHFLVNKSYIFGNQMPQYFKPFDDKTKQAWDKMKASDLEPILKELYYTDAKVYEVSDYYMIDLQKL